MGIGFLQFLGDKNEKKNDKKGSENRHLAPGAHQILRAGCFLKSNREPRDRGNWVIVETP
jgi:hypothetical protein